MLVRPIVEYGAEIWGEKRWKKGEDLQIEMEEGYWGLE